MTHEHQASVAKATKRPRVVSAGAPGIRYPAGDNRVRFPLVASGVAPDDLGIDLVYGRLVDQTTAQVYPGLTLPFPLPCPWAVYFRHGPGLVVTRPLTLEVFGIALNGQGVPKAVWHDSLNLPEEPGIIQQAVFIGWPASNETDLCPSSFVPYGTYNPAGTIAATLKCGGTTVATASSIYYDPSGGIWAAQFDPFAQPSSPCQLDVTLTTSSGVDTRSITGLGFQNC
jgi:hypothetical protein